MADVKLNSLATKTNANAAAILVKDSATKGSGGEGWITKAQLSQIIRDEIKAQMSAITSGTPDVPVLDGNTLKYMTLANFAKVVGGQRNSITADTHIASLSSGWYTFSGFKPKGAPSNLAYKYGHIIVHRDDNFRFLVMYANETNACYIAYTFAGSTNLTKWLQLSGTLVTDLVS